MEWKPIETAPKDGTRILVYAPDIDRVLIATFRPSLRIWVGWRETLVPTHWMRLPNPPWKPLSNSSGD
jgi:hypothetical protein